MNRVIFDIGFYALNINRLVAGFWVDCSWNEFKLTSEKQRRCELLNDSRVSGRYARVITDVIRSDVNDVKAAITKQSKPAITMQFDFSLKKQLYGV